MQSTAQIRAPFTVLYGIQQCFTAIIAQTAAERRYSCDQKISMMRHTLAHSDPSRITVRPYFSPLLHWHMHSLHPWQLQQLRRCQPLWLASISSSHTRSTQTAAAPDNSTASPAAAAAAPSLAALKLQLLAS
jgi:hypothetical protein